MATEALRSWQIVSGPSKWDYINSHARRKVVGERDRVLFLVIPEGGDRPVKQKCQAGIDTSTWLEEPDQKAHDEGEDHEWGFIAWIYFGNERFGIQVIGSYNTKTRRGKMKEVDETTKELISKLFSGL